MGTKINLKVIVTIIAVIYGTSLGVVYNEIISVSPNSAAAGTSGLTVTFTLDTDNPPAPPGGAPVQSAVIGTISGSSITHTSQYTVTAEFNIPAGESTGTKDVSVSFSLPTGDALTFLLAGGFTVTDETPVISGTPYEGYNLFAPINSKDTYLMDNDSNIIKTWTSSYNPGLSTYLLEDGTLLRAANTGGSYFNVGGCGGRVEQYSWSGSLLWSFNYSSTEHRLHHDIEMLPNGNILMIAWEVKTDAEILAAGGNLSLHTAGELWPDTIIEVQPNGTSGSSIVWQWNVWDHLIQDYDAAKPNYGIVSEHPEKINLNYAATGNSDWNHINSVDYNAELDQILLSVHNFSEIWIIDHSISSAQAQGSDGDLLYRWGNPQAYGKGTSSDQKLFVQHDAEWIEAGLPGEGDILIFNNGQGRTDGNYSSIEQITPPLNPDGSYTLETGEAYGPAESTWTYTSSPTTNFYSANISGSQRLANGNTLICEGTTGRLFEVTTDGDTVWEYNHSAAIFRVERYSPDYEGFIGTELEPEPLPVKKYSIVDTAQTKCFNDNDEIASPSAGSTYYGQDAQYDGNQPSYTLSSDGLTVYDNVTSLTWTQSADINGDGTINIDDKLLYTEALDYPDTLNSQNYGGYNDWRLPSIKELYSLMNFAGRDPSGYEGTDTSGLTPFIDTDYFDFGYGDTNADERIIDAQWASSTLYVSTTMDGNETMFGLNLADGRIKGYPTSKQFYVYFVRGNTDYGINNFVDNNDGTISDEATGLMWSQDDSGTAKNWPETLIWVQQKNAENYLGYNDWRLPNIKELQSIVDYTRSPQTSASPAIDPVFNTTSIINEGNETDYPYFWSSTTHQSWASVSSGTNASYVAFGKALGYWNKVWQDVHGAGAQRSDPKTGDPAGYPTGHGPQGDAIRIYNYSRLVRDIQCGEPGYISELEGDMNNDCRVDMIDFATLSNQWLSTYSMTDLNAIVQNWLHGDNN